MNVTAGILEQSPHDCESAHPVTPTGPAADPATPAMERWVSSRFTLRATAEDGSLVLWNTFEGSMTMFPREQRERVAALLQRRGFEAPREGVVDYLASRGFILRADTDEDRRFELAFGRQHYRSDTLDLTLLASEDCNFRCTYCYETYAHGTLLPEVRSAIRKLVEERAPGLRALSIGWFGGEPLYGWRAVEDLAPFFHATAQEHELVYTGHMTTNGYLLRPEIADKLLAWGVTHYQITLDGPPDFHDRSRPTRTGEGSFAAILANLQALAERPETFSVSIRVNFDRTNCGAMNEFFDLLAPVFSGDERFRLRFHPVGRMGGANDGNLTVCEEGEITSVAQALRQEAAARGLAIADGLHQLGHMGSQVCYATRPNHFVIGATGKVMKCTVALDKEEANVVGQLGAGGTLEIDHDKLALWAAPYFQSDPKCKKCVVLPQCQGFTCPLPRVRDGRRSCVPERAVWKKQLLSMAKLRRQEGRRKFVEDPG